MKFEVDEKLVEPIIRDHIAAAVVAALGNTDELIRQMVVLALKVKVQADGSISQYSSYNSFDFIEAVSGKAIREAATKAILEIVENQKPAIQAAIEDELRRAPKKTAASIISAFCQSAGSNYRITANFQITNPS